METKRKLEELLAGSLPGVSASRAASVHITIQGSVSVNIGVGHSTELQSALVALMQLDAEKLGRLAAAAKELR